MRYALAIAAVLAILPSNASAATEMPKELRGTWCWKRGSYDLFYIRCREANIDEGDIRVGARKFWPGRKEGCTPLVITPIRSGRSDYSVEARCDGQDADEEDFPWNISRWRLFHGGHRLKVTHRHA